MLKPMQIDSQQLQVFRSLDTAGITDFCTAAVDFLLKGVNPKLYKSAANKLGVTPEDVKTAVKFIADLVVQMAQNRATESEALTFLNSMDVSESFSTAVLKCYTSNLVDLNSISTIFESLPQYKNLEWRLDVQVASRTLQNQVTPMVLLNLTTEINKKEKSQLLQMRPDTLAHVTRELEKALMELKSREYRKLTTSTN